MIGKKRYGMGKRIAKSIYGEVRLGFDFQTRQIVAIKLSRDVLMANKPTTLLENPVEEVRILRLLAAFGGHPNVLALLDHFSLQNAHASILEYADGGELYDLVDKQGTLPSPRLGEYFRQIVEGLLFVHSKGVAHLDISLENVLIHRTGSKVMLKLCDFGVAREIRPGFLVPMVGKPGYMAPELLRSALQPKSYDCRTADIFSLGVCLFVMSTGYIPFEMATGADPRFLVMLQGGVKALLDVWDLELPPSLVELLDAMICPLEVRSSLQDVLDSNWLRMGAPGLIRGARLTDAAGGDREKEPSRPHVPGETGDDASNQSIESVPIASVSGPWSDSIAHVSCTAYPNPGPGIDSVPLPTLLAPNSNLVLAPAANSPPNHNSLNHSPDFSVDAMPISMPKSNPVCHPNPDRNSNSISVHPRPNSNSSSLSSSSSNPGLNVTDTPFNPTSAPTPTCTPHGVTVVPGANSNSTSSFNFNSASTSPPTNPHFNSNSPAAPPALSIPKCRDQPPRPHPSSLSVPCPLSPSLSPRSSCLRVQSNDNNAHPASLWIDTHSAPACRTCQTPSVGSTAQIDPHHPSALVPADECASAGDHGGAALAGGGDDDEGCDGGGGGVCVCLESMKVLLPCHRERGRPRPQTASPTTRPPVAIPPRCSRKTRRRTHPPATRAVRSDLTYITTTCDAREREFGGGSARSMRRKVEGSVWG